MKLIFHEIQFFGSILQLYIRQIFGILCLQIDLFLIVECIWYHLGHVYKFVSISLILESVLIFSEAKGLKKQKPCTKV